MTSTNTTFEARLAVLSQAAVSDTLTGIKHGVEREALRIESTGKLSQAPHPRALGSALTHEYITTDFSESLLEFITPPEADPQVTLGQLRDIHKFVLQHTDGEQLWPMSMPCYVTDEDHIPIAQYGESNIGKMKTLYRVGLKNRYGSMMQAIAGVHFNFSLPDTFWAQWLPQTENIAADKDAVSAAYFGLIRNYRRFCWLIPYLFGASPALCGSFIRGKESSLPFEKLGKGSYYLPYATSLRMSDLGYTNSAQSDLAICYNKVDTYIASLRKAINTPSEDYQAFGNGTDGELQQLNDNVLQIENELYSPIRPKQPTRPLEKPTDALDDRGVSYIEVRALDVNPFSDVGIEEEQFYFLDVFLLYCLVTPSPFFEDQAHYAQTESNLGAVVTRGRDPALRLQHEDQSLSVKGWAEQLFTGMGEIADILDKVHGNNRYSKALDDQWQKVVDPDLTPSGKLLGHLLKNELDNGEYGMQLAAEYKASLEQSEFRVLDEALLRDHAVLSLEKQATLEAADTLTFEQFLQNYFDAVEESKNQRYA